MIWISYSKNQNRIIEDKALWYFERNLGHITPRLIQSISPALMAGFREEIYKVSIFRFEGFPLIRFFHAELASLSEDIRKLRTSIRHIMIDSYDDASLLVNTNLASKLPDDLKSLSFHSYVDFPTLRYQLNALAQIVTFQAEKRPGLNERLSVSVVSESTVNQPLDPGEQKGLDLMVERYLKTEILPRYLRDAHYLPSSMEIYSSSDEKEMLELLGKLLNLSERDLLYFFPTSGPSMKLYCKLWD